MEPLAASGGAAACSLCTSVGGAVPHVERARRGRARVAGRSNGLWGKYRDSDYFSSGTNWINKNLAIT